MTSLTAHIKFPQSVQLFRFCFRVLEIRSASTKLNDQHLGQILSFNPSETSHWKRGKKCLKQNNYLEKLSDYLNIDLDTVEDLADGHIVYEEAMTDFTDSERMIDLKSAGVSRMQEIELLAKSILEKDTRAPVCLLSLFKKFPFIQLIPSSSVDSFASSIRLKPGNYLLRHNKYIERPYSRLAMVRELCQIAFSEQTEHKFLFNALSPHTDSDIINLANALLMPHDMLAAAIPKVSTRTNLIKSLSETFCVPKSAIRMRLTTLLEVFAQTN